MDLATSEPAPPVEMHRCKVVFENLEIPSRYYMLAGEPYNDLRSKVRHEYRAHGLSRRFFLLLWIDVDGDEILLDSEESLVAAFNCVPLDQSGFRILRILARHSSTTVPDQPINNESPPVCETEPVVHSKNGMAVDVEEEISGSNASLDGMENSRNQRAAGRRKRSLADDGSSSHAEMEQNDSPEISNKPALEDAGTFPCSKCGRSFGRKSSRSFHQNRCRISANERSAANHTRHSAFLAGSSGKDNELNNTQDFSDTQGEKVVSEFGPCAVCGRIFKGKSQWTVHQRNCRASSVEQLSQSEGRLTQSEPKKRTLGGRGSTLEGRVSAVGGHVCIPGCGRKISSSQNLKRHQRTCQTFLASADF